MIGELMTSGAMPALEASLRFAAERQRLIAHNIANLNTPNFQTLDVSVQGFQSELRRAIEKRREGASAGGNGGGGGGAFGELPLRETGEIEFRRDGSLRLTPETPADNVLFHDRNNRDVERLMQDLAENSAAFRFSTEMIRSRTELLRMAISQRV